MTRLKTSQRAYGHQGRGAIAGIILSGWAGIDGAEEAPRLARVAAVEADGVTIVMEGETDPERRRWKIPLDGSGSNAGWLAPGVQVRLLGVPDGDAIGVRLAPVNAKNPEGDHTGVRSRLSRSVGDHSNSNPGGIGCGAGSNAGGGGRGGGGRGGGGGGGGGGR